MSNIENLCIENEGRFGVFDFNHPQILVVLCLPRQISVGFLFIHRRRAGCAQPRGRAVRRGGAAVNFATRAEAVDLDEQRARVRVTFTGDRRHKSGYRAAAQPGLNPQLGFKPFRARSAAVTHIGRHTIVKPLIGLCVSVGNEVRGSGPGDNWALQWGADAQFSHERRAVPAMMGIVGPLVVFLMVFGGYVLAGGHIDVVLEALPHEMMTIGGGAAGAMIIGNTPSTLKGIGKGIKQVFSGPHWKEQDFKDVLCLLFTITKMIKSKGILVI